MANKKIVVLGAGYAGILVAKKLAKKLKGTGTEITIIDKNPFHTMLTELHEVAACRVEEESIRLDLKKVFAGRDVNVVLDNIQNVDYANNVMHGIKASYEYDYMVLATGCVPTYFGVKGAKEHSFTLWSYADAVRLRDHIQDMFHKAAVELDEQKKRDLLTFYVIGSGFTGIEMVGELAEMVPITCEKFGIDPSYVTMINIDMQDRIMSILPEKSQQRAMARLVKLGIKVILKTGVTEIGEDYITYKTGDQETTAKTHTVMWCAGTQGSEIIDQTKQFGLSAKGSRIEVDGTLRTLEYRNVYVGGDNMYYIPPGEERPVPQMVENCEHCAPIIAKNIVQQINDIEPTHIYKPNFHGVMVCIGGKYGTANIIVPEFGIKQMVLPSFFAMLSKHFINMVYFVQVLGWHKIFNYMNKQFFTIKNDRSFVGGHLGSKGPDFLTLPLRIWMGSFFLMSVYQKYAVGYLNTASLSNRFSGIANTFRPEHFNINIFNHFRFSVFVEHGDMHLWFQTSPVSAFIQNFVINTQANEIMWQHIVIGFQALLGLAFLGGLFTTLASLGAIAYAVALMLTVGLSVYELWILFGAFAFMFWGGRVLSLDYWVIPWLSAKWKNIPFVKKWYLYN